MKLNSLLLALVILTTLFSCKKKTSDEVVPLQNVRLKKDARYYYHYDTDGRIIAKDILINDAVSRYWNYSYTAANKIESRIQVSREHTNDNLRNQYFIYDSNNRLDKVVKKEQATTGTEYLTDSICLHYDGSGQLSYAINYTDSATDSLVYSNFHKSIPMSTITYKKWIGYSTYDLNFSLIQEYDQYDNIIKSTSESLDPTYANKREYIYTYELFSDQTELMLENTNEKSDYFSFAMSMWTNDGYGNYSHFQKGKVLTDYTRSCTENFVFTLQYDTNGFIKTGTSKGTSTCYDGNNFEETYTYKDLVLYETF